MKKLTLPLILLVLPVLGSAQTRRVYHPPPLRIHVPFESAWNAMQEVLVETGEEVLSADRAQGRILTRFREYMSGPLTAGHLAKVGQQVQLSDADWIRAECQYEILIELVETKLTLVTVYANIRGLKRDFFGKESWVDIASNGNREEYLLTQFGRRLFGQTFKLDEPRKGFWERDPQYVPDEERRIPRIAGPERP
ncbi:MAG: hypothetical protein Kow001_18200 [Acidobacteriota bacterium]